MKKKKLQCSVPTLLLAGVLCLTLAACGAKQSSDMLASDTDSAASAALPVKAMNAKRVDENPYMAKSDANIHHDGYNTDSTDEVLPLGIYPEINVSYEKTTFASHLSPAILHSGLNSFPLFQFRFIIFQVHKKSLIAFITHAEQLS